MDMEVAKEPQSPGKKRPGPAPTGQGKPVIVRCHDDLLAELDDWRSTQRPIVSRAEALRVLSRESLARWKPKRGG